MCACSEEWEHGIIGKHQLAVPTLVGLWDWATTPRWQCLKLPQYRVRRGTCCSFLQWDVEILPLSHSKHCLPLISALFLGLLWSYISPTFTKAELGPMVAREDWCGPRGGGDGTSWMVVLGIKKPGGQKSHWKPEVGQPCGILPPSSPAYKSQPEEWEPGWTCENTATFRRLGCCKRWGEGGEEGGAS